MRTARPTFPRFPAPSRLPTSFPCTRGLFCAQLLARVLDLLAELAIARHLALHLVHAVNHGRVIAPAERLADLDELHLQELPREIHGDLAGHGERLDPRLGAEPLRRDTPPTRDHFLHPVDGRERLAPCV